ncbi:MAG: DUF4127 family protein [Coprobacillus sp.]
MKTLLIPLDERPCNRVFPDMIGKTNKDIELLIPDKDMLGDKKIPTDTYKISQFLLDNIEGCDNAIISLDMLLYGGLIPSRLHNLSLDEAYQRLHVIKDMKKRNPNIKIYAFSCIMRAPSYDSSEEEPDYYEQYGYALFRRKYLMDYDCRHGLSEEEKQELANINIPEDIIHDYEQRRDFNTIMNLEVIQYLEKEDIDFLVIPQDDSSPYGYTAISQKKVIEEVKNKKLETKVMIYPGADEVAMSLLARAYHEYNSLEPKVYAFYASVLGPSIVPNYEDRPMYESLKSHIRVCKARLVENANDADYILAINCPGKIMQESFVDENEIDISYTSYRHLLDFAYRIEEYIHLGYKVALCDSAFSNGGDLQLVQYLDELEILDQLVSYAGWNTNCNSLGTTLSQMFIGKDSFKENLCYRIIEDVFYQAKVRGDVVDNTLPSLGLSYYNFKDQQNNVEEIIKTKLLAYYNSLKISHKHQVIIHQIYMPWRRMFEIGMDIEVL